jgi:hypothetical protein
MASETFPTTVFGGISTFEVQTRLASLTDALQFGAPGTRSIANAGLPAMAMMTERMAEGRDIPRLVDGKSILTANTTDAAFGFT